MGNEVKMKQLEWILFQSDQCSYEKRTFGHKCVWTEERPYEDTEGRLPSASHRERPQKKPNLSTP